MIKFTITKKILSLFIVSWLMGTRLLSVASFIFTKEKLMSDVRVRLKDYVEIGVIGLSSEEHKMLIVNSDEESVYYTNVVNYLRQLKDRCSDVKFVYTMRKSDEGIIFVGDAETDESQKSHLGDLYEDATPLMNKVIRGFDKAVIEDEFSIDEWGTLLSAYAPIYTKDGKFDGLLGMDISINRVNEILSNFAIVLITIFVVINLIIMPLLIFLAINLTKSFKPLLQVLKSVSDGDFSQKIPPKIVKRTDEFGELANFIDKMNNALLTMFKDLKKFILKNEQLSYELSAYNEQVSTSTEEIRTITETISSNNERLLNQVEIVKEATDFISTSSLEVVEQVVTIRCINRYFDGFRVQY